jgi:hypothetical protein
MHVHKWVNVHFSLVCICEYCDFFQDSNTVLFIATQELQHFFSSFEIRRRKVRRPSQRPRVGAGRVGVAVIEILRSAPNQGDQIGRILAPWGDCLNIRQFTGNYSCSPIFVLLLSTVKVMQ